LGIPVLILTVLNKNALPITTQAKDTDLPVHYGHLVPRVAVWFSVLNNRVFFKLLCSYPLALEGRRKPVNWLQRHPLIYPIFSTSLVMRAISVPFARENLHLVISHRETQPLNLHYLIVNPT
jgi:hypothetical protein